MANRQLGDGERVAIEATSESAPPQWLLDEWDTAPVGETTSQRQDRQLALMVRWAKEDPTVHLEVSPAWVLENIRNAGNASGSVENSVEVRRG